MSKTRKLLESLLMEDLLKEQTDYKISTGLMRKAVQAALAYGGDFDYPSSDGSRAKSSGIRINPTSALDGKTREEITRALERAAAAVGLVLGDIVNPRSVPDGREKPASGTFYSWPITNINDWFTKEPDGTIKNAHFWIQALLPGQGRKMSLPNIRAAVSKKALSNEVIVVNSRSLQNKLFTGQGLGELAEYATAAAINGESGNVDALTPSGEFKKAVEGAILEDSWKKADDNLKAAFADAYTKMRDKAKANMGAVANPDLGIDFGSNASVQGGGGGTYDVVSSTALIHVKFDDPSRLGGLQQKKSDLSKPTKDTTDDEIVFGTADRYWKNQRAAFKAAIGEQTLAKDKELLAEWGFYEYLLEGNPQTRAATDPSLEAWRSGVTPGTIADKLIADIQREIVDGQQQAADGSSKTQFYFGYFPDGENDSYTLKIEILGFADAAGNPLSISPMMGPLQDGGSRPVSLKIEMHPTYSGTGGSQVGRPYIAKAGDTPILELEFRAKASAKPIQLHRGSGFSHSEESPSPSMSTVLINEIRASIRRIIQEENERSSSTRLSRATQSILMEELTKSDKKDIDKMIKKRIEADRSEQKKIIQKEMANELKKTLGKDFFGNPGKLNKAIQEIANEELMKEFSSKGKAKQEVVDITKRVLKKFYREISLSSSPFIDRIKL